MCVCVCVCGGGGVSRCDAKYFLAMSYFLQLSKCFFQQYETRSKNDMLNPKVENTVGCLINDRRVLGERAVKS